MAWKNEQVRREKSRLLHEDWCTCGGDLDRCETYLSTTPVYAKERE